MGSPANTVWVPVNASDWTYGVISHNSDFDPNSAACVIPPADSQDPPDNDFQVTYSCNKGDDSMVVVTEPDSGDPCVFQLTVDSSVVCEYIRSLQGSSSTGPAVISSSSSSSSGAPNICKQNSTSYSAPFDLYNSPILHVWTNGSMNGTISILPCGK